MTPLSHSCPVLDVLHVQGGGPTAKKSSSKSVLAIMAESALPAAVGLSFSRWILKAMKLVKTLPGPSTSAMAVHSNALHKELMNDCMGSDHLQML